MSFLDLHKLQHGLGYDVYWENGKYIGAFLVDEDGYYKWWPEYDGGYFDEGFLIVIVHRLQELNQDWDKKVKEDLERLSTQT